jgi:hypothetical protein
MTFTERFPMRSVISRLYHTPLPLARIWHRASLATNRFLVQHLLENFAFLTSACAELTAVPYLRVISNNNCV